MKLSQLKQIIKEEIQNALNEEKRTFKLKIINKNGTSTIQSVSVDPSTTELFTIIANLKQSKNVKDVKILEDEIQNALKETNSKEQTAVEWLVSTLNKPGFAPVLTEEEINNSLNEATGGRIIDQIKQTCVDWVNSEDFAEWRKASHSKYYFISDKEVEKFLKAAQGNINIVDDLIRAIYKLGFNDSESWNFISDALEWNDVHHRQTEK